ncbi:MAG: acyltransferase domain-containing protein, partial [Acidobacteriota bacterium]|nr:acyltransferase domain-containing protein [Acidobacteriota bacterium]
MKASAAERAVAIVGVGAIMPDAPNAPKFWQNIREGVYSIKEVPDGRWNPALYYDADPKAPDKTYSKIGGWVCDWEWDPLKWKLPIPPRVSQLMDLTQKWGVATAREALADYGYPARPLDPERTAVIYGNAMGGDQHLYSAARIFFPEFAEELEKAPEFAALPAEARRALVEAMREGVGGKMPAITEDTMPGELSNILAGRIAALYDFRGPNYSADAACASTMAAMFAALKGLCDGDYDAVLTGGVDANMGPSTFVKFCKIGALSATGSRPYAAGADGFIMGEGGASFLLKRLADAERDGDRIYAVVRGIGGSSDGKGKGITAPNPAGQKLCVRRAWDDAGFAPAPGTLIEGHGTSTPVGDAAELQALGEAFKDFGLPPGSVALGSVKSNIGHLKGGAGAAGIFKAALALRDKVLPPSLNFAAPNPNIDFGSNPFRVNTELREWESAADTPRRAAVSAFGFGGTNFHIVLEEYVPGRIASEARTTVAVSGGGAAGKADGGPKAPLKAPLRGALVVGAATEAELKARLEAARKAAEAGDAPAPSAPLESDLRAAVRVAVDYADAAELADKLAKALKALEENQAARWKALRPKGIFFGKGPAPKVAFLFTGQGSQYVNMIDGLRKTEPVVAEVFKSADETMTPLLGKPLTDCIYLDKSDEAALAEAENGLKQTAITQPAVLATETALARLIGAYGIAPDMVMGHSLGEYGALVAAGAITFENALKAVSARGQEMTKCAMDDNGLMAAAFGPIDEVQKVLDGIAVDDYVVIANINSSKEAVIGGSTKGVERAVAALKEAGFRAQVLQVSHAFHTKIVAPAGEGLTQVLEKMNIQPAAIPIITNVTGGFYPSGPGVVPEMIGLLGRQVSSPVQFIKGLNTLYDAGARVFVEMGPKRILYGFVEDVLGGREDVLALFTNHPRIGEAASVNMALCGLYAAGLGSGREAQATNAAPSAPVAPAKEIAKPAALQAPAPAAAYRAPQAAQAALAAKPAAPTAPAPASLSGDRYTELGKLFAEFLDRGLRVYAQGAPDALAQGGGIAPYRDVCITGAALGLPGVEGVFQDTNVARILGGDIFINPVPQKLREEMVEKNIVRLVKSESGEGHFEAIDSVTDVIKLAARAKGFDIERDFGFPKERMAALDRVTRLAIGAGLDALRDAGIPLVMRYKTTTKGTLLPDRWQLPEALGDDTGVLFTSAFPGYDFYAQFLNDFNQDQARRARLKELEELRALAGGADGVAADLDRRVAALKKEIDEKAFQFDRRFLFQVLSMGHSQFAEYIGARGPNTAINAACSSGTQAVALASDWIRTGRCRRVIIISADDITSDNLFGWFGSGFLASGSAATGEVVEEEATPFDRRRHGLIIGMGASSVVLESAEAARERGVRPICQLMGSVVANSAFHGTRLDVSHIRHVMERLVADAEREWGVSRHEIAPETVFVSHETYTPARGGSAAAEIFALRHVFGEAADQIVIANTKGATGHPMAVGIEDVVSVKILETGIVPPVPNFKEVDPELGNLNLSKGGAYPVRYALRLGAGFGSQISMTLLRWTPGPDGRHPAPTALGYGYRVEDPAAWEAWLRRVSGYAAPEVEVVRRTLRVKDQGPTALGNGGGGQAVPVAAAPPATPVPAAPAAAKVAARLEAPAPAAPALSAPAAAPAAQEDAVKAKVMAIIAEKTGYPTDMLDLDLDLEADLGIDTVKQAEVFATIRETYDIPREDNLKMRDFPTLAHVTRFVYDRRPDLVAAPAAVPSVETASHVAEPAVAGVAVATSGDDPVKAKVMAIIAEKTGYPTDMLDPDLDLEADLGIDTVKQAEMFAAIRETYDIPREDNLKMRDFPTLAHVMQFVYDRRPDLAAAQAATAAPAAPASGATPSAAAATPAPAPPVSSEPSSGDDGVKAKVLEIIAEKTGYPTDMLDPDLDLEADLGIDTVKQAEMFAAIRETYDIPREDNLKMRDFPTLAHVIQFVYDRRP